MCYDQAHSLLMLIIQRTKHSEYAPYMTRLSSVSNRFLFSDLPLVLCAVLCSKTSVARVLCVVASSSVRCPTSFVSLCSVPLQPRLLFRCSCAN
jgi:hypothetical protein